MALAYLSSCMFFDLEQVSDWCMHAEQQSYRIATWLPMSCVLAGELVHSHTGANKVIQHRCRALQQLCLPASCCHPTGCCISPCGLRKACLQCLCGASAPTLGLLRHISYRFWLCERESSLRHMHAQVKLEYYIRMFLEPKERPEQELFPPGSGPAGNWR